MIIMPHSTALLRLKKTPQKTTTLRTISKIMQCDFHKWDVFDLLMFIRFVCVYKSTKENLQCSLHAMRHGTEHQL